MVCHKMFYIKREDTLQIGVIEYYIEHPQLLCRTLDIL